MAERKIILNLAVSSDGYICDPEGHFAWISGQGDRVGWTLFPITTSKLLPARST